MNALLDAGANVNARAEDGDAPLHRVGTRGPTFPPLGTREPNSPPLGPTFLSMTPSQSGRVFGPYDASASDRDTAIAAALVRAGANLEARNDRGETALGSAARRGDVQIVSKLLELGATLEPGVVEVAPPAVPVCAWQNHELYALAPLVSLEGCLEAGVDVSALDRRGFSPLHALLGQREWNHHFLPAAIAALLGAGADVNARDASGATPLHHASGVKPANFVERLFASPDAVVALLAGGAEVNARDRRGGTPLHVAVHGPFDNTATATALLDAGADANARQESGRTPLYGASGRTGDPAMVRLLIDAGAEVNGRAEGGETPLHRSVREQNPAVAALLLELGADPALADDSGTVADPASCHRWPDPVFFHHATAGIVARCLESGAEVDAEAKYDRVRNDSGRLESYGAGSTPIHVAAGWTRDPAVIALLTSVGAEVNARNREGYTPLHYAARDSSEPAVVAALIAAGADVNAWATRSEWDITPLYEAAANGNAAIVVALVDAGADVNAVAAGKKTRVVREFGVPRRAGVNALASGGRVPLHRVAAENANPAVITELVSRGADVNARLPGGRTALHEAAARNANPAILAALLEAGADVNARGANDEVWTERESMLASQVLAAPGTPWGGHRRLPDDAGIRTPLHEAVMGRGDSSVVATLIAAGADVNASADLDINTDPAATPLHWAVSANPDPAVLELLVRAGADVNARGGAGRTPLHIAALRNPVVFPKLLELGADPTTLDRGGKTPMDYAVENLWLQGMAEVRRLMREKRNESGQEGSNE